MVLAGKVLALGAGFGVWMAPMLDIKVIRERAESVRARLARRGDGEEALVDEIVDLDERWRAQLTEVEGMKAEHKRASKVISTLVGQEKFDEAERHKRWMRHHSRQIASKERRADRAQRALRALILKLPNLPHKSAAKGASAADNVAVREWGERKSFSFAPKNHRALCEDSGLVDFARGAKLAGSGFLLYTDWGARLERALIQFLLELHTSKHGYTEVSPPFVVNRACMEDVGQLPKFADQAYAVREGKDEQNVGKHWHALKKFRQGVRQGQDEETLEELWQAVQEGKDEETLGKLWLIPTAEAPVANMHRGERLSYADLPIRYCAYSPCFRAEAGAAGTGTRGMIRVHQFDKVELIKITLPDRSYEELESMVGDAERVLQLLGLHYRVVLLCAGDLGFASAKTYDIEVWAPGQEDYLEVSSCSNCEDFQSRRMELKYKSEEGKGCFPHMLNGSGTALARLFVALVETHQQKDGSVLIPEALRPFLRADRIPPQ